MRVFVAYRPVWPSFRAQALQVAFSAHALASRGHEVTVCFHAAGGDPLKPLGLKPLDSLRLVPLPDGGTAASWAFRAHLLQFAERAGVILAREKRMAEFALRWTRCPVVLEAHEVDSLQGRDTLALERRVLDGVAGLITNCEGVMAGLRWLHDTPDLAAVIHNAGPDPIRRRRGHGVVWAGSAWAEKGVSDLLQSGVEFTHLGTPVGLGHKEGGTVEPKDLLERLASFEVGLVPLGTGWFGRELTSPLKAFSYRSAGLAIVGADTPALRRTLGRDGFVPYTPGVPSSLSRAVAMASRCWERQRALPVRTWGDRAIEVESVLSQVHR